MITDVGAIIKDKQKGVAALVLMAFLYALMGVWVRFLGKHLALQITARTFAGFALGLLFYKKHLRLKTIKSAPRKDILLLILRSLVLVIGIGLYTASIMRTKYANVSFIFALPTTAFLLIVKFLF